MGEKHCRYYRIADVTVQVESDLPITDTTFHAKFKSFEVKRPSEDTVSIRHHFFLPDLDAIDLGTEVYRKIPWIIYKKNGSWIYLSISSHLGRESIHRVAFCSHGYKRIRIHSPNENTFRKGNLPTLTLLPTDQILLAQVLANRKGCFFHSSGVILEEKGFLFLGHSEAGKSTIIKMLQGKAEILCDDRIIVRKHTGGFKIHGTWSHGEVPQVSSKGAPLEGIFFLEKDENNQIIPIDNRKNTIKGLLDCIITSFETNDWWQKTLSLIQELANEVPCYSLRFDKSGEIVEILQSM